MKRLTLISVSIFLLTNIIYSQDIINETGKDGKFIVRDAEQQEALVIEDGNVGITGELSVEQMPEGTVSNPYVVWDPNDKKFKTVDRLFSKVSPLSEPLETRSWHSVGYDGAADNGNEISASVQGTAASWNRFTTDYGYIQLGPANTTAAHIYTDATHNKFVFNKPVFTTTGEFSAMVPSDLFFRTGVTPRMTILASNGFMGVGTSSPTAHLHVKGAGLQRIKVQSTDNYAGILIDSNDPDGSWQLQVPQNSSDLNFINWSTANGNGTRMTILSNGNVGIGTTSTVANLHVNGTDGLLVQGTYGSGSTQNLGAGTRMHFYPKKAAFRAGYVNGSQWNDANIGEYSVAMGEGAIASGYNSIAIGLRADASGNYSTAIGPHSTASGTSSTALGESNAEGMSSISMGVNSTASGKYSTAAGVLIEASGEASTAMGRNATASGYSSVAMGLSTKANSYCSTAFGSYNVGGGSATTYIETDPLFEIGNGLDYSNRKNALTVLKNGQVGINVTSIGENAQLKIRTAKADNFGILVKAAESGSEIGLHTATSEYSSLAKNCYFDTNWKRFDLNGGAFLEEIEPFGDVVFKNVTSGTNPISWTGYMKLDTNGNLYMENPTAGYYNAVTNNWVNGSSRTLKQDIKPNEMDLDIILEQINIVNYRFIDEVRGNSNAPYHVGFIAEDTPKLLSGENQDGMVTGDCIGLLLAVVKEQNVRIDVLTKRIEYLESN